MATVRTAVEAALVESAARLRGLLADFPQTTHSAMIRDAVRVLDGRSQQLTQLPELPMRITEAEELKELAESIRQTGVRAADRQFSNALALAVLPVLGVLREHARPENWTSALSRGKRPAVTVGEGL